METVETKKEFVSGRLGGFSEEKITVILRNGWPVSYPYNGICNDSEPIDLQWVFENMGHSVICEITDGEITNIKRIGTT